MTDFTKLFEEQIHLDRRELFKVSSVGALSAVAGVVSGCDNSGGSKDQHSIDEDLLTFTEVPHGFSNDHVLAPNYVAHTLISWGDSLIPQGKDITPESMKAEDQKHRFGPNCDYVGFFPVSDTQAVLGVNHEFPNLMAHKRDDLTKESVLLEQYACGISMIGLRKSNGQWRFDVNSVYNRRINCADTPFHFTGPARKNEKIFPAGTKSIAIGTLNNCAGGVTPWQTYLSCEENFDGFFGNIDVNKLPKLEQDRYAAYGIEERGYFSWYKHDDRFNLSVNPNVANQFGWVVEIDPLDPSVPAKKHTALGRMKHEAAETGLAKDGRVVVYMGDDAANECVYKFISKNRYDKARGKQNSKLLEEGTLFVAKFESDRTVQWIPLEFGSNGLTPENGFDNQADVCLYTRMAAKIVGGTPMDRPEDIQPSQQDGEVFVMLTNNVRRTSINSANPRVENFYGHILKISEDNKDLGAMRGTWEHPVICGNPADPNVGAKWNPNISANGWFACPDNCAIDARNNLWISTDQGSYSRTYSNGRWPLVLTDQKF